MPMTECKIYMQNSIEVWTLHNSDTSFFFFSKNVVKLTIYAIPEHSIMRHTLKEILLQNTFYARHN